MLWALSKNNLESPAAEPFLFLVREISGRGWGVGSLLFDLPTRKLWDLGLQALGEITKCTEEIGVEVALVHLGITFKCGLLKADGVGVWRKSVQP